MSISVRLLRVTACVNMEQEGEGLIVDLFKAMFKVRGQFLTSLRPDQGEGSTFDLSLLDLSLLINCIGVILTEGRT